MLFLRGLNNFLRKNTYWISYCYSRCNFRESYCALLFSFNL